MVPCRHRQNNQERGRIGLKHDPPTRVHRIRRANPPVRRKVKPVDGPDEPGAAPRQRPHGKERKWRAGGQINRETRRGEEHNLFLPDQETAPLRSPHERVEGCQLVIQPCAGKAQANHKRRVDVAQRLVEIGGVLFGDMVERLGRDDRAGGGGEAVEIPVDRIGHPPCGEKRIRPTVRSHDTIHRI